MHLTKIIIIIIIDKFISLHGFKTIKLEFSLKSWYRKLVSKLILVTKKAWNFDLKVWTDINEQRKDKLKCYEPLMRDTMSWFFCCWWPPYYAFEFDFVFVCFELPLMDNRWTGTLHDVFSSYVSMIILQSSMNWPQWDINLCCCASMEA